MLNNNNDAFSSLFNPALPSHLNKIRFSYSGSQRYIMYDNAFYNNLGLDLPIKNIGTLSIVRQYFNLGEDTYYYSDPNSDVPTLSARFREISYNINFSREIIPGLSVGAGINYFKPYMVDLNSDYYSLNFGIDYSYSLVRSDYFINTASIGAAFMNCVSYSPNNMYTHMVNNGGYLELTKTEVPLSKENHLHFSYILEYDRFNIFKDFKDIETEFAAGYTWLFNSRYYTSTNLGIEIRLLEILSFRTGYYKFVSNWRADEEFTYGLGINFPLYKFAQIPITLGLDYAYLKQPGYLPVPPELQKHDHFNSLTFNINYNLY
jgi:hypothetical protein